MQCAVRTEQNLIAGPGAALRAEHVAEFLTRTAIRVNSDELVGAGEECERPAVGRPERILGTVRSRDQPRIGRVEMAQPEPAGAVTGQRDKHEPRRVRRDRDLRRRARKRRPRGRLDREADARW